MLSIPLGTTVQYIILTSVKVKIKKQFSVTVKNREIKIPNFVIMYMLSIFYKDSYI